jgi:membrane fusion protein, multidrug efflux system
MRKKIIIAASALVILCIVVFFVVRYAFLQKNDNKPVQNPKTVVVMKVRPGNNIQSTTFPAYVQASCEAVLFFRVSGPIVEVNVKPGDKIKKGTVMFKIDSRDYERKINLLKHQLTSEKARLEKATRSFKRYKMLCNKNAVSKELFDQKLSEYLVERARVSELESSIRIACDHLKDTELKAPFDGIVTEQHLEKHEMARAGEPVLAMHDISLVEVVAFIPEDDIVNLVSARNNKFNNTFYVCFPSIEEKKFKVKLYEWNTRANPTTRTYGVVFRVKQPAGTSVLPGMTAELIWEKHKINKLPIFNLPVAAFVSTTLKSGKIWIVDPETQTAVSKIVGIGKYSKEGCLQVTSGLESNALVIIEGTHFLRKGTKVKIMSKTKRQKNENF